MWEGARQRNWRERLGIYTAAARSFLWAGTVCRMSQTQRKSLTLGTVSVAPKGAHIRIDVTRDHITWTTRWSGLHSSRTDRFSLASNATTKNPPLGQHTPSLGDFMTTRGSLPVHSTPDAFSSAKTRTNHKGKSLHNHRITCLLTSEAADPSHRRATQTKAPRPSASCHPRRTA